MSSYSPGQFDGAKNATLPGGPRLPFMSQMPVGEYVAELESMEGGKDRYGVDQFRSTYKIISRISGDENEAYPPAVNRRELRTSDYYMSSIKGEIVAVMGGTVPVLGDDGEPTGETRPIKAEDIDTDVIVAAVTEGIFDGQRVLVKVWSQENKAKTGWYTNSRTYPLPAELVEQYGA